MRKKGFNIVSREQAYNLLHPKLVKSYALEAILQKKEKAASSKNDKAKAFIKEMMKSKGLNLDIKYNKHYCGFKAGFFNAFRIGWIGSKPFAFFFKLPKNVAEEVDIKMTRYETGWKDSVYYIEPGKTKIMEFLPLLKCLIID